VEGHATLPYPEDRQRISQIAFEVIEEHRSQPPADDDAEGEIQDQVVDLKLGNRRDAVRPEPGVPVEPAAENAGDIGQAVPAQLDQSEIEKDGVDLRIGQDAESGKDEHRTAVTRLPAHNAAWNAAGHRPCPYWRVKGAAG